MSTINTEALVKAVGKNSRSEPAQKMLSELNISEQDLKPHPLGLVGHRFWSNDEKGLQLEFEDIGLLENIPYHDIDDGPWTLTKLVFWGVRKKKPTYSSILPYGLNFYTSREATRKKFRDDGFGEATQMGLSGEVDMWNIGSTEITIDFSGDEKAIRCIAIGVPINRNEI
ncbi:hypothetical protein ABI582_01450 [Pseudomonas sp. SAS7]|uniref:hypothetical protein n=1 Tax=Pseudomonas sp. SAS7 TaxID=3156487 RepID=UPI003F9AB197